LGLGVASSISIKLGAPARLGVMKSLVTAVYFLNDIARKEYLENYLTHLTVTDEYELAGIRDNVS